ncbi:sn-glycerol-3-phosphate ABC transporter ATP-binding protein UgpC [Mesorhizobium sp. M00.F.Ca.ET.216.01.1.1]|uniref:ABC transporter ATP-binding protein n=1 Tax=Mesorhizobium sp. M00.F.Ca.ET.216.01.1.1 TaxID=2500528 RepID=UPI000FDB4BAD|nr:sn-glycerol-3-phosphate ABC transporter ATP-binding protein UgpC [Mesorhizobium sp. M00.F.Ca.ET.216.01.1.1]TGQ30845.1 sn-glycerol-3-phosphate ABC transporter ATP-binding protein UgpC [Mesorhizobium sp. M00.F.Ca.ET.216.01.1.1]TJW07343.1 MAG: sn-glycerol-3-phosphate ABC transporter ATP-binding protein UgpC [Mesorhizobium sp.]
MASVAIGDVYKSFGTVEILHGVSVDIDDGEFVTLVGPSGCGKSTLLRMIAGLEKISRGQIAIGERVVNNVAPKERDVAMVFQNYALYPHMTVAENMAFSLMLKGVAKAESTVSVKRAAEILGLVPLLSRYPRQLSGGQRQRVAMGRAIVRDPAVFLFDEPLSNLDAKLRVQMRAEIKELHQRLKTTTVYVTHDQIEAMTMADKIVVMHDGLVEQIGPPLELYDRPNNLFVASFIGSPAMNMLRGEIVTDGSPSFRGSGGISLPLATVPSAHSGEPVVLGVRPEHLRLSDQGIPVTVVVVEPTGSEVQLIGRTAGGEEIVANFRERHSFTPGETVRLSAEPGLIHLFHGETGQRLETRIKQ